MSVEQVDSIVLVFLYWLRWSFSVVDLCLINTIPFDIQNVSTWNMVLHPKHGISQSYSSVSIVSARTDCFHDISDCMTMDDRILQILSPIRSRIHIHHDCRHDLSVILCLWDLSTTYHSFGVTPVHASWRERFTPLLIVVHRVTISIHAYMHILTFVDTGMW